MASTDRDRSADLLSGFDAIGLEERRRAAALEIIEEVLVVNSAIGFGWYKPPHTDHLACSWDGDERNRLWVSSGNVRVRADGSVVMPTRRCDWKSEADDVVGWQLPGASGGGGGRKAKVIADVLCPETFVRQPVGSTCPTCEVVHPT